MSLATPERIRTLQRRLYAKAKKEPQFRFYTLYDKIYRWDILEHAYHRARANAGAPGVDGVTFEQIEASGVEEFLRAIQRDLQEGTYRAEPVRRVEIPKPDGKSTRPLGIPAIRTRVIQTAALLVLVPIFEADLPDNAWGYRPKRSAGGAVKQVHKYLQAGYTDVVDADLRRYFETIPHAELMRCVARRISDGKVLALIKAWLQAPIVEQDDRGRTRRSGGKHHHRGTPQGGVISPLDWPRFGGHLIIGAAEAQREATKWARPSVDHRIRNSSERKRFVWCGNRGRPWRRLQATSGSQTSHFTPG